MTIKTSGNFAQKLDRWSQLLETSDMLVSSMSRIQSEVALTLIGEEFETETDPYGEHWAPKKSDDGRKILHGETTRLRNGWHVVGSDASGFEVAPSVDYAGFHQSGTSKMVARKMVPTASRGFPREWVNEFKAVATAQFVKHFGLAANGTAPNYKHPTSSSGATGGSAPANDNGSRRGLARPRSLRRLRSR